MRFPWKRRMKPSDFSSAIGMSIPTAGIYRVACRSSSEYDMAIVDSQGREEVARFPVDQESHGFTFNPPLHLTPGTYHMVPVDTTHTAN